MPSPTYTLIQSTTLTSTTSVIDFTSIPSSYYDLRFHFSIRTTGGTTGADLQVTFNGDTGNAYRQLIGYTTSSTTAQGFTIGTSPAYSYPNFIWGAGGNVPTAGQPAGLFSNGRMLLPGYVQTSSRLNRSAGAENATVTANIGSPSVVTSQTGQWNSTAAVNRVTFTLSAGYGQLAVGTTISLYGCNNTVT
jgi:hypothetical protein